VESILYRQDASAVTNRTVDLALALAHRHWATLKIDSFDMRCVEHVDVQQVWRSLVFGRAWLQSTIGVCTADALLWLPPFVSVHLEVFDIQAPLTYIQDTRADNASAINAEAQVLLLASVEVCRVSVIAAIAMRTLSACSTRHELLPAVQGLVEHISAWHDGLPPIARASELSRTPWGESKVFLAYIHLGHLGAITLIFRRTLSMYKQRPGRQKHTLHPAERGRLAAVFHDGLVAAKQASHILYLLLGEQAGIRHCWTLMYALNPQY
jgi:hypothetical protein